MRRTILLVLIFWIGAVTLTAQRITKPYSFFVAGHTYGNPVTFGYGLYQPFVDKIPFINSWPGMKMGFLTGDIAYYNSADYLDSAIVDIKKFEPQVRPTAGNHDVGAVWHDRFGELYYSYLFQGDLFIVLCPVCGGWDIQGDQLDFLEQTLFREGKSAKRIFIFMHELIYWTPDQQFSNITINFVPGWPGPTNYWSVVEPLLRSTGKSTYLFTGDLGACQTCTHFHYHRSGKIHYVGSGMGSGYQDNFIIADVYQDSVHLNLIALGNNPRALGNLVPREGPQEQVQPKLWYRPSQHSLAAEIPGKGRVRLLLSDLNGREILNISIRRGSQQVIQLSYLPASLYVARIQAKDIQWSSKIWIAPH